MLIIKFSLFFNFITAEYLKDWFYRKHKNQEDHYVNLNYTSDELKTIFSFMEPESFLTNDVEKLNSELVRRIKNKQVNQVKHLLKDGFEIEGMDKDDFINLVKNSTIPEILPMEVWRNKGTLHIRSQYKFMTDTTFCVIYTDNGVDRNDSHITLLNVIVDCKNLTKSFKEFELRRGYRRAIFAELVDSKKYFANLTAEVKLMNRIMIEGGDDIYNYLVYQFDCWIDDQYINEKDKCFSILRYNIKNELPTPEVVYTTLNFTRKYHSTLQTEILIERQKLPICRLQMLHTERAVLLDFRLYSFILNCQLENGGKLPEANADKFYESHATSLMQRRTLNRWFSRDSWKTHKPLRYKEYLYNKYLFEDVTRINEEIVQRIFVDDYTGASNLMAKDFKTSIKDENGRDGYDDETFFKMFKYNERAPFIPKPRNTQVFYNFTDPRVISKIISDYKWNFGESSCSYKMYNNEMKGTLYLPLVQLEMFCQKVPRLHSLDREKH